MARLHLRRWFWVCLPWLILLLAVARAGYPMLQSVPFTHDHPTHLFKAWHMATQMLPSFRVRGFSHFWVFGFPSDELVPPGEELWVVLFRVLTFGKLTWVKTYGVAMVGLLAFCTASMFRFARQYFGTLAGVIAGLLFLWDPGAWAEGGWEWYVKFGVWPVTLGASSILFALGSLEKLLARGTARQFVLTGLWVAAAFISHQVTILFLPVMVALLLLDHWFRRASSGSRLALGVLACAFGAALIGFYLWPMLARADQTLDLGVAGPSLDEVGQRVAQLKLFGNSWPGFVVLGFIGAGVALRRRMPGAFFLSVATALFVFLSSDTLISTLHLDRVLPNLRKVEAQRMLYGAKLTWFPLVAYAIALPFGRTPAFLSRLGARPLGELRRLATRYSIATALAVAAFLPFAKSMWLEFQSSQINNALPEPELETKNRRNDLESVWAYTAELRAASKQHYRIAYDLPMHDHLSTAAPVFDNTLMYKVGYTPTQLFTSFPMYTDTRLYKQLSVKYVVSDHGLDATSFTEERKFGQLHLYRFNEFDPNPFTIIGAGKAELLEFSPERIRLRLSETDAKSRLKLHVSYMDHWRARQGGSTLHIVPAPVFGIEDPILMEVPVQNGELIFEYVRRKPDWIGLVLSLSAVPVFVAAYVLARRRPAWLRPPLLTRLLPPALTPLLTPLTPPLTRRAKQGLALLAALSALAACVAVGLRLRSRSALVPQNSIFRSLADDQIKLDGKPCKRDGSFRWICGGLYELKAQRVSGLYGTHACMSTGGKSLEIRADFDLGEFVTGIYDVNGSHGSLQAWLDDRDLGLIRARQKDQGLQFIQFDTRDRTKPRGTLKFELTGSPLHCFDFRIVR